MNIEQMLRVSLRRQAGRTDPAADWAGVARKARARRSRRRLVAAAAAVTALLLTAGALSVWPTGDRPDVLVPATPPPARTPAEDPAAAEPFPGIYPDYDDAGYRASWARLIEGRDRWRRDPREVARRYLADQLGLPAARVGPFEPYDNREGQVGYTAGSLSGSVVVLRLARGAPYDVREAVADGLSAVPAGAGSSRGVVSAGALHDPLLLEIETTQAGTVTAQAGRFAAEWQARASAPTAAGRPRRLSLRLGGGSFDDGLLVRVDLAVPGAPTRTAEFRVDPSARTRRSADPVSRSDARGCQTPTSTDPAPDQVRQRFLADVLTGGEPSRSSVAAPGLTVTGPAPADPPRRFTVIGDAQRDATTVVTCVQRFAGSADQVSSYAFDRIAVTRQDDGRWLVSTWERGQGNPVPDSTSVAVLFLTPAAQCGEADREFRRVMVPLPAEERDLATLAVRELFSGVTGRAPGARTDLPADARVRSVVVRGGVATVDISDATDAGGGSCLQNARREQLRRTLLALPGIRDVQVLVDGRPGEAFQS